MESFGSIFAVSCLALLVVVPWVGVMKAKTDSEAMGALRHAATATVLAVALLWGSWILARQWSFPAAKAEVRGPD